MSSILYDIAVIGSGPGGQRAAVQAAKLGKKVVVIERDQIGGNCLHWGTVPSKTLREAVLGEASEKKSFLKKVMKRKNSVVVAESRVISDQLSRNQIHFVQGSASFLDANTLEVKVDRERRQVRAKSIVIASGTRPRRPEEIPFEKDLIMDSDDVLSLHKVPKKICILGAGVIGCEYASIFLEMGSKVTLIDRRTELLRGIDREMVSSLEQHFRSKQMKLLLGTKLGKIEKSKKKVLVEINDDSARFDALLYCMGRSGNIENLKLDKVGIKVSERGLIEVNSHFQSSVPHIYAVGDIIGAPALAASAYEQGRLAACHCFKHNATEFPELFPYGIYTIPEISSVGREEKELQEKGIDYVVGRAKYKELARGKILGDEFGLLKLLFEKESKKLIGAHIIGSQATELIHLAQVAMSFDARMEKLTSLVFNYPTLAEAYKVACLDASNQLRQ